MPGGPSRFQGLERCEFHQHEIYASRGYIAMGWRSWHCVGNSFTQCLQTIIFPAWFVPQPAQGCLWRHSCQHHSFPAALDFKTFICRWFSPCPGLLLSQVQVLSVRSAVLTMRCLVLLVLLTTSAQCSLKSWSRFAHPISCNCTWLDWPAHFWDFQSQANTHLRRFALYKQCLSILVLVFMSTTQ